MTFIVSTGMLKPQSNKPMKVKIVTGCSLLGVQGRGLQSFFIVKYFKLTIAISA